jgi:hypothetical protein
LQRATPPYLIENGPVFVDKRRVKEEAFCQCGLGTLDGLPIRGTEIRAECEANLQEKVVGEDVREGACDVRMVLDLAKARLDVIGVHDNVFVGVGDPEVVCPDQDVRAHRPKQTCEFGALWCRCHGVDQHGVAVVLPGSVEDLAILMCCGVMKQ